MSIDIALTNDYMSYERQLWAQLFLLYKGEKTNV